jgi:cysteine desulfurase
MRDVTPFAVVVGADAPRIPNTSAVAVPGWSAETLVIKLDLAGVAVSAGAACSSGKVGASRALTGLGLPPDVARAAIRVSFGWQSSEADLESFLSVWAAIAADAASRRAVA